MQKFLVIQTAFIGDVVLSTAVAEKLHRFYPHARIDYLVRKGNEALLHKHPYLHEVIVWNKKEKKTKNLFLVLKKIRSIKYDKVINLQRYFSTGLLTAFSGAKETIGFDKNPLSFLFSKKVRHVFDVDRPKHEVERNNDLINHFTDSNFTKPVLYPSTEDFESIRKYTLSPYLTMTPSSVWFTKKYPAEKWISLLDHLNPSLNIYLLGGKENMVEAEMIRSGTGNKKVEVLAGKLNFLQAAALMSSAQMNYVNDSAPLHFASALNAPVTAIFCSTIPGFGYGPLSDISFIVETKEPLTCRPCGIHGYRACPLGHFECAYSIKTEQLTETGVLQNDDQKRY